MWKATTAAALALAVVALLREPSAAQQDAAHPIEKWEYATVISHHDPKLELARLGERGFELVDVQVLEDNSPSRRDNDLIYILKRPKQ